MAGVFLSLDGLDGTGKSTQLRLLVDWLRSENGNVVECRDPGGTAAGEEIRRLLLNPGSVIAPLAETLLYMASRAQLLAEVVRPALERGAVVVCDRFLLATIVYQGHAGGLDPELIRKMGLMATDGLWPDWTGVLDLDPDEAAARRTGPADRIEGRPAEYHRRVRAGFLAEGRRDPDRIAIINAGREPFLVHADIVREVGRVLDSRRRA